MNDLISRQEVLDMIDRMYYNEKDLIRSVWERDSIKDRIKEIPTAYDVGKVVRQLDILRDKAVKQSVADTSIYATGMMGKAIQIVKAGGIDDK